MKKSQILATALCVLLPSAIMIDDGYAQVPASQQQANATELEGLWEGEAETGKWPLFLTLRLQGAGAALGGRLEFLGQGVPLSSGGSEGASFKIRAGKYIVLEGRRDGDRLVGHLVEDATRLPFSLRRVPTYPKPATRVEAWTQDLDALETRFLPVDRSFSPGEALLFREALAAIRSDLPRLTDAEVTMKMASAIALADNPHTRLYLLRNATELRRMPIRLWWFSDGLRVVRTDKQHRKLLGCQVDSIGGKPARLARDLVAPAFAGTPSWIDYKSVYSLTSPEALQGMGVTKSVDDVEYGLSGCAAAGSAKLKPLPLVRSEDSLEAWWDLTPLRAGSAGLDVQVLDGSRNKLPLYLRNPTKNYWFEYLPAKGILYFQYNRSSDAPEETTEAFGKRLLSALDQHPVKGLVIDYRFNTGGNLHLGADLTKKLQERTKGIRRWIVAGRSTFSAGITHVASWREAGNVTIIGEPVGDTMEFWAEGGNIKLPNSGYEVHFANGRHSYSPAPCPQGTYCYDLKADSLDPDIHLSPSWAEYRTGKDPVMDAILRQAK
jgi:hypothetical protein